MTLIPYPLNMDNSQCNTPKRMNPESIPSSTEEDNSSSEDPSEEEFELLGEMVAKEAQHRESSDFDDWKENQELYTFYPLPK